MATADVNFRVIDIINEVQRKLGLNTTTFLDDSKLTTVLLDFLNDVIDEVSDYGDWPHMFREVNVTAVSSVGTYEIAVSSQVKNIYEVHFNTQVAPLEVRTVEDLRRLQKLASFGTPRQFALVDVSGVNPRIRVYPIPGTPQDGLLFDVAYFKKPSLYTTVTADSTARTGFPSRMLVQGVYAKALLEESGEEPTNQYQIAYAEYQRMRKEALNRFTSDTGTDIYIQPIGGHF